MMVLAREDVATRTGAIVRAELLGYGLSADGFHPTAPHPEGEGAARAITAALATAGVEAARVGYVNGHGTGTPKNDSAESLAIRRALGPSSGDVLVSSTKSQIGHLLGGAGAVEAIVTVMALEEQVAPPTANFVERDPACDIDCVPNVARPMRTDIGISNNFAFGGANACVVFGRPGATAEPPPRPASRRVVVTGLATLTPAGCDPDLVADAVAAGRRSITVEDGVSVGRVDLDPSPYLTTRDRRRMDRISLFATVAAKLALRDARLEIDPVNRTGVGVIFGTGIGPMESVHDFLRPLFLEGFEAANPAIFPNTVYNAAAGQVSMHTGAVGPTSTITAGHAAGAAALTYGYDLVSTGRAEAMLCVATDVLTDAVVHAYVAVGLLSDGLPRFALAEASVGLLLEPEGSAPSRGAHEYGELLGYGIASDGLGVGRFDRRGEGVERAIRLALDAAGRKPDEVDTVWAGYFGHPVADRAEASAIRRVLGRTPDVRAPKLLLGEPMGVGGALNAAIALKTADGSDDGPGIAIVNSSSLGGTHVSLVLATSP
jgi:3-oxoacyl-[acyl-carrier-protein] synthase II